MDYTQTIGLVIRTKTNENTETKRKLMNMNNKYSNFVLNKIRKAMRSLKRTNEEGGTLRHSRLRKFGKRGRKLALIAQIAAIWYLSFAMVSYLTTDTGAYFNDVEVIENTLGVCPDFEGTDDECIPIETDWDKTSLDFDNSRAWADGCSIYTTIFNASDDRGMTTSKWIYYVYKFEDNKPVGEPVATGEVPKINKPMSWGEIEAQVPKNGDYKFTVKRPDGHPGNNTDENGDAYIGWSQLITVTACGNTEEPPSNDKSVEPLDVSNAKETHDDKSITLTWEIPSYSTYSHVKIYRNSVPLKDNISENSFVDGEVAPDTEYTYKIVTVDNSNMESSGSTLVVKTNAISIDDETNDIEVTEPKASPVGKSGKVDLSWKNPTDKDFSKVIIYRNDEKVYEGSEEIFQDTLKQLDIQNVYKFITVNTPGKMSNGVSITVPIITN